MNALFMSATETKIVVRVKAKDAKFIGSSLGGAYVIIRNNQTDEILAQGKTKGSTGNTDLIMNTPHQRGQAISDSNTAKFVATIDIDEPTFVTVEAFSPITNKQARINASTQLWLIPGKHILADGLIIEIPGFIIDILEPRTHQYIPFASVENKPFKLRANIVMMCGCTIDKEGIWDSEKMEVKAIVKLNGNKLSEVPLNFVSTNLFEAELTLAKKGDYEVIIYAYSSNSGNTGVDKVNYIIY
ncbi:hypothetical protein ICJ85_15770 [Aestuariibaculum marinum]|uniref:Uncharacterized protein n=2 Tax=Aestuariibaculum marinum TaxID=2683592 RepID=A0A8J6PZT8_9FLAO|nr:hypothetical protein [Aestuariibaculum marinum]